MYDLTMLEHFLRSRFGPFDTFMDIDKEMNKIFEIVLDIITPEKEKTRRLIDHNNMIKEDC